MPSTESVRLHLLHLIASHHGEMAFGSPVVRRRPPKRYALHYIDNLDAKMEMVANGYAGGAEGRARTSTTRVRPLPSYLVEPLKLFPAETDQTGGWMAPDEPPTEAAG